MFDSLNDGVLSQPLNAAQQKDANPLASGQHLTSIQDSITSTSSEQRTIQQGKLSTNTVYGKSTIN
jgi:hypothetical protein